MIRAVNNLQKRTRSEVLEGMRSYRNTNDTVSGDSLMDKTRLFFLMRVLFIPDNNQVHLPPIQIGMPDDVTIPSPQDWPIYPLTIRQDVPLLIVPVFTLAGDPEDPLAHIEFFEQNCHLREAPLRPPSDPLNLADELLASAAWYRPQEWQDRDRAILRAQLLRLVNTAYQVPGVEQDAFFVQLQQPGAWAKYRHEFEQRNVVWDDQMNRYEATS